MNQYNNCKYSSNLVNIKTTNLYFFEYGCLINSCVFQNNAFVLFSIEIV